MVYHASSLYQFIRSSVDSIYHASSQALMLAAFHGRDSLAAELIARGAGVDVQSRAGGTLPP